MSPVFSQFVPSLHAPTSICVCSTFYRFFRFERPAKTANGKHRLGEFRFKAFWFLARLAKRKKTSQSTSRLAQRLPPSLPACLPACLSGRHKLDVIRVPASGTT